MAATPALEGAIHQARGSGQALSDDTRQPMERAFGADFSRVKVHTDAQADQLNRSIQARAFTTGSDIFFRQGEHSPGTRAGQELLAHELTHVVQQSGEVQRLVQANRGGMETSSDAAATTRFGHDFSRIPIHSLQQAPVRTERTPRSQGVPPGVAKGETLGDEELFSPLKGEPGTETEGESATKGEGAKKVKKTELAAPTAGECGAYSWKVRFSVENTDATTTGYVVQKVDVTYARKDCIGNDKPVTGIGTFPYWEAWGVRGGKVFIGDTASEHNADTYADPAMGDRTYGSIAVKGTAEFFPNVTLPAHMKANNPATQAGALRSSTTDPALAGGTGSIPHDLTASWDCCGPLLPGAKEKLTTFSNKR